MKMTISRLFIREILYRKTSFLLGLLSVVTAMTAWIGAVALLRAHDIQTDRILVERERATQREMQQMEDDYRRIMRDLGYNVMIVSDQQDLSTLRAKGHPDTHMPFNHVLRLAHGRIDTLNHLLPVLQQRVEWPEHGIDIILSGTPGQIPLPNRRHFLTADGTAYRNPIMQTIPDGELIIGSAVATSLNLQVGDQVTLMGEPFRIRAINPPEGTSDDIAVWCTLDWAQQQLQLEGMINLILALECVCSGDSLGKIIAEVTALTPDVQVMEFSSRVQARALARERAAAAHRTAMAAERDHRQEMGDSQRRFASILAPLVVAGAVIWMFFLFVANVRERLVEIGILRAIGTREATILGVFMLKSIAIGLIGAAVGFCIGHLLAAWWNGIPMFSTEMVQLLDIRLLFVSLLAAPALCALAAWIPAVRAIRRDPARILCEA